MKRALTDRPRGWDESAHERVRELLERGQAGGSFRTDLSVGWLVASCFALIHAKRFLSGELRDGGTLCADVAGLFVALRPASPDRASPDRRRVRSRRRRGPGRR